MQGEPVHQPVPSPDDPDKVVILLQRQIERVKRWFEWERSRMEARSFAPPERAEDESAEQGPPGDRH